MKGRWAHRIMWKLTLLSIFIFQFSILKAVETIVVGEVVNEATGEPIPNVNIHFRGTKIGTTTDETGSYVLRVDMKSKAQLVFSAIGYYSQRYEVEPGAMAGLQVTLKERAATITEVVVSPTENPALAIIRQVREHRAENDRTLKQGSEDMIREQSLFVSHINKRTLRRALWRSLRSGMIEQEDSTYVIPLYHEKQSFRVSGNEMIATSEPETRAMILSETEYSMYLSKEGNLNFYSSTVPIMNHSFLSPLSASGNLYYRYYIDELTDIMHRGEKDRTLVRVAFRTRNPFYTTFNGDMLIDTATYAVRAINAYVPSEVAVNYVNNINIKQVLSPDGALAEEHISVILDVAIQTKEVRFPTILITNSLYNQHADLTVNDSLLAAEPAKGQSALRSIPLVGEKMDAYFNKVDSLPIIRTAKWIADIVTTGYIPTGTPIDIGHIEELLQVNSHEGVHMGLPFRTNEKFSKNISLEVALGYGFKDRRFKGLGRASFNLPTLRKNILQIEYNDHYVWSEVDDFDRLMRENSIGMGNFDFTSYAFEALHLDSFVSTATHQKQLQVHWFADWTNKVETHAYLRVGWQDGYSYQLLSTIGRISWGEQKHQGFFMRRYTYSTIYPVLFLGLETGHWSYNELPENFPANSAVYAHVRAMLTQHANLGMAGKLTYVLRVGAIFGHVPSTLTRQANRNQGYAYDPYRMTLSFNSNFFPDKYLALQAEWNGQGILFNLIPGIRWLHLRELVETKIAYGYISPRYRYRLEEGKSPHEFYSEIGIGLGNLLRICDLYSVWSITPEVHWALRFRLHIGL